MVDLPGVPADTVSPISRLGKAFPGWYRNIEAAEGNLPPFEATVQSGAVVCRGWGATANDAVTNCTINWKSAQLTLVPPSTETT